MSDIRSFWQTVYERFDPEGPARPPAWRAERPYSPRASILAGLDRPFGTAKHYVVLGTVGTGKTTELLAIAQEQTRERMVVFLDVWRHFEERVGDPAALDHVQPWEILLLIGLSVYGSAQEVLGHAWSQEHLSPFERAVAAFHDSASAPTSASAGADAGLRVDLAKLAGNIAVLAGSAASGSAGAALVALGKAAGAGRWDFQLGVRGRAPLSDQDDRVRDLQNAVNLLIGTLQQRYQRLLVVVDGLDRIRTEATTRGLFTESTLLGSLVCATVLTGPLVLRRRRLAAQMRHFEPKVLANVPVLDQRDPTQPGPGIDFFLEVYARRMGDLDTAALGLTDEHLRRLAFFSGGRVRDFVRFVRMVAERAWDRALPRADGDIVDDCIDERRRVMEMGLDRGHIRVLAAVMQDPEHLLPEGDQVDDLLDQWSLLPYPNESEWYFPHPLLTMRRVRPEHG